MAVAESIKEAVLALEIECGWAVNLAQCFVAASGDQGLQEPPWINQFSRVVNAIQERAEAVAQAVHSEARKG